MRQIEIAGRVINDESEPYVICEIGNNHQGSLETCKEMFRIAKECGADAVKLQKRDNKTLYTKAFYNKPYDNPNSYGKTYGEHREFLEFGTEDYLKLLVYAFEIGITFFATAFDRLSSTFLDMLDIPAFKVASADLTNIPLIEHIASFGKPMIISTGGATVEDIDRVYVLLKDKVQFAFLHCVASYPNQPEDMNLSCISLMRMRYPETVIGFSDHYNGTVMAEAASIMGASIIEKHFTLNHTWKGTDHALSLEPQGMETMVHNIKRLRLAMGDGEKRILDKEVAPITKMGKSIWPVREIKQGETLALRDFAIKSPGGGLKPYELEGLEGKIALLGLSSVSPVKEGDFE